MKPSPYRRPKKTGRSRIARKLAPGMLAGLLVTSGSGCGRHEAPRDSTGKRPAEITTNATLPRPATALPPESAANTIEPPRVSTPDAGLARALTSAYGSLSTNLHSAEAWGRYAQGLEAAEFLAEARRCYGRARELDPTSARWTHLLGLLELQEEPERGLSLLETAARLGGDGEEASRVRLAQALVERGRFADAEPQVRLLLGRNAGHAAARLELARIRLFGGKLSEASEALQPCLTNPYTARPAAQLMGQIRGREGLAEEAARWASRSSGMPRPFDWPDPYQREVQAWRADRAKQAEQAQALLAQRRFADADAFLADALAKSPADLELLLLAGRSLLQQRRCAEAEARFREHLRVAPDSLNGLTQLSLALLCQQRWTDAVPVLERSVALKPDFAQAHANLAVARSRLGDRAGAIRSHREALRCNPGDAGQHAALADELARAGETDEARRHAGQALNLDPTSERAKAVLRRLGGP
ncbi:MAG: tetratricopeptide repeat protein [Verrucomicrobiales bacterium]|nr:tetratricopeptide repeat protein [Verrucomicrobiales bacterium]